jgi:hypothetical protein
MDFISWVLRRVLSGFPNIDGVRLHGVDTQSLADIARARQGLAPALEPTDDDQGDASRAA